MLRNRVIPCLLVENQRLVKTERFRNPRYVGDPINAVKIFNEKEVDELVVLDISASTSDRRPNFSLIEQLANEAFMPLSYGGGIRTIDDAKQIFRLGIEKIVLNTEIYRNREFLRELCRTFAASSVVASVDMRVDRRGRPRVFDWTERKHVRVDVAELVTDYTKCGVGEVLIQCVDRDGTMSGPDFEFVAGLPKLQVPLVVAGGVSNLEDIRTLVRHGADAVAVGAYFVFHGPHRAVLITYPDYATLENLFSKGKNESSSI
jgi:imidazole glycerol-phosphate synthase subunit HisF